MKLQRIPVRSLYKRNKKISDIETTRDKIEKYLYANIATLFWSSFLLLGGIIFVAYYAHIGYMPDFDLKSSITITAAVAVTGVVSVIVLMITMVLPSIIWVEYWGSTSILKNNWSDKSGNPTFIGIVIWFVDRKSVV